MAAGTILGLSHQSLMKDFDVDDFIIISRKNDKGERDEIENCPFYCIFADINIFFAYNINKLFHNIVFEIYIIQPNITDIPDIDV